MSCNLSDSELAKRLRALGLEVGPINDSTRDVYIRKYKGLIQKSKQPVAIATQASPRATHPASPRATHPASPRTRPITPPPVTPAKPPPAKPPSADQNQSPLSTPPPDHSCFHGAVAVVELLLMSFDNLSHVANDTAFLFPSGEVMVASRAVLTSQCSKMTSILYKNEALHLIRVMTLSGQSSEFMIREGELVRDLKEKICLVHSIPLPEQRLIYKEQEMADLSSFSSLGITGGATLHLVLNTSELHTPSLSYICPGMSPSLSTHHFTIGLNSEQQSYFTSPYSSPQQAQRVTLPPHILHLVHVHDLPYPGFRKFLKYLYCRELQEGYTPDAGLCSSYLVCFMLGVYFDVPVLPQECLSIIPRCLSVETATILMKFSQSIKNKPLEQLCISFLNSC